jgi:hypothetical protein
VIVLKPPLRATIGHLLNQRRLLALLFVTSCVDPPSAFACARALANRLSLDGLVSAFAHLGILRCVGALRRTCVHALSSFQRTEAVRLAARSLVASPQPSLGEPFNLTPPFSAESIK